MNTYLNYFRIFSIDIGEKAIYKTFPSKATGSALTVFVIALIDINEKCMYRAHGLKSSEANTRAECSLR